MQVILYLDVFWVTNSLISEVILIWVGYFLKKRVKIHKMLIAGMYGGFCATVLWIFQQLSVEAVFARLIKAGMIIFLFFITICGMIRIAFGKCQRMQWRNLGLQLLSAAVLLAGVLAIPLRNTNFFSLGNTRAISMPLWELIVKCVLFLSIMPIYSWVLQKRKQSRENYYRIEIEYHGIKSQGIGFMDTGNCLRSPLSQKPVAIAQDSFFKTFLEEREYHILNKILKCDMKEQERMEHIVLVPYHSIGKSMGVLPCLRCEHLRVWKGDKIKEIPNALIAFCNENISNSGDYQVILHVEHVD